MDASDDFWGVFRPLLVSEEAWDEARDDVRAILEHIGPLSGKRVLVIPGGTGQHAIAFAECSFDVTTVDSRAHHFDEPRRRAEELGVELEFVTGEPVEFQAEEPFDLVVNLISSAGQGPGNDSMLKTLHDALAPEGRLVMEMVSMQSRKQRVDRDWKEPGSGLLLLEEREFDWSHGEVRDRWMLVGKDGARHQFQMSYPGYDSTSLAEAAEKVGLRDVEIVGSFAGDEYGEDTRLILYARK